MSFLHKKKRLSISNITKLFLFASLLCFLLIPAITMAQITSTVTVNAGSATAIVPPTGFGIHTSVYDNNMNNSTLPARLLGAGTRTLRYPGGSYADGYHWAGHYNPIYNPDKLYLGVSTDMGHFSKLVDNVGGTAIITVNYGSNMLSTGGGEPAEAAAWVAYCNASPSNTTVLGTDATGFDWKTAGFWASVRSSAPLATDDGFNYLRISHPTPLNYKYWEIGNEVFGGNSWEIDRHPIKVNGTYYGQQALLFISAMKAVDPTIKIGVASGNEPFDTWASGSNGWDANLLKACGNAIDFVVVHFYPGSSAAPTYTMKDPATVLAASGQIANAVSTMKSLFTQYCGSNAGNIKILVTETDSGPDRNTWVKNLFAADVYGGYMENGSPNVDWLELHSGFLDGGNNDTPIGAYYGIQMAHWLMDSGDTTVSASSSNSLVAVHAVKQTSGNLGIMLINKDPNNSATVTVSVSGVSLTSSGAVYTFTPADLSPNATSATSLGNSFTATVPAYSIVEYIIPQVPTTTITVASSANPINKGGSATFTLHVTSTVAFPSGTVTLFDNGNQVASATLSSGFQALDAVGSATVTFANAGTHKITAVYSGNASNPSVTTTFTQIVNGPWIALWPWSYVYPGSQAYVGTSGQYMGISMGYGGSTAPTGIINLYEGNTLLGKIDLATSSATGVIFNTAGSHTVTYSYDGDVNFGPATATATVTIGKATPTVTIVTRPNPSELNTTIECDVTVAGSGLPPSGTVTLTDGSTTVGTATLVHGLASLNFTLSSTGNHTFTASYPGDDNYNSASATYTQTVNKVNLNMWPWGYVYPGTKAYAGKAGEYLGVTMGYSGATPTGTVTLTEGSATLGTITLSGGNGSTGVIFASSGKHTVTYTYSGDDTYNAATATYDVTIYANDPPVTISASPKPANVGDQVTYAITVTNDPAPTGTVTLSEGSSTLGTGTLSSGKTTITTSFATAGDHTVTASYSGDSANNAATGTDTITINTVTPAIAATATPNPVNTGNKVTSNVTVSGAGAVPTGTVTISEGSSTLATITLSNGSGSDDVTFDTSGSHTLTYTYNGDANYNSATTTSTVTVNATTPTITISGTPKPASVGDTITYTVTLANTITPTGTVTLSEGSTTLGTGTLSSGTTTITTSFATAGNHTVTASYSGDSANNAATGTDPITINTATPTIVATATPATVAVGDKVTSTVTVTGTGTAPTGTVTISESGTTLGTITLANGSGSADITFSTSGNHTLTYTYNGDANYNTATTIAAVTVSLPTPTITSLSPTTIAGASTFTLTVNGTNFVSGSIIKFNGTNMTTTYVSPTQLTAAINKYYTTLSSYPGTATVSVLNPDGKRSPGASLTITQPVTPPVISSLSPSTVSGAKTFTLTVNGSNFVSGSIIKWNGTNITTTYMSATQLTASINKYYTTLSSYPGSATISILNPDGNRSTNATLTITAPLPAISLLSPASVQGATTFTLTVNGSNFVSGSIIKWNGTNLTTTFISATQLTASINKYYTTLTSYPGSATVSVLNPDGGRSTGATIAITQPVTPPTITSLSPSSVTGATTFTLTVNGAGFQSGAVIKWNGTNMTTTFVSSTQLTATIGKYYDTLASYPGSATVSVLNPDSGRSTGATIAITQP